MRLAGNAVTAAPVSTLNFTKLSLTCTLQNQALSVSVTVSIPSHKSSARNKLSVSSTSDCSTSPTDLLDFLQRGDFAQ